MPTKPLDCDSTLTPSVPTDFLFSELYRKYKWFVCLLNKVVMFKDTCCRASRLM